MCARAHRRARRRVNQKRLGPWFSNRPVVFEEEEKMSLLRLLAFPVVAASIALAAPARAQGTDEQRSACTNDAFKLCSADIPDEAAIESCLRRNQSRLTPACRVVMRSSPSEETPRAAHRQAHRETATSSSSGEGSGSRRARRHEARVARHSADGSSSGAAGLMSHAAPVLPALGALLDGGPDFDDDDF
jgi:hypothetical protein